MVEPNTATAPSAHAAGAADTSASDATDITPPSPFAVLGLDDATATTLLLSLLVPLLIAAIFLLRPGRRSGGGRSLLLFGPVGAGKTALYHQLRFGRMVPTVTSMEPVSASFVPKQDTGGGGREVHAVDMPGNGRLRSRLLQEAPSAAALVCVIDATQLPLHAREAAGQLYEVLAHEGVVRRQPPLLVCVNKSEAAGAATPANARKAIEQEIERVRHSRTTMADTSGGGKALRGIADDSRGAFSFDHLNNDVSFVATSAANADVAAVVAFAQKHAR